MQQFEVRPTLRGKPPCESKGIIVGNAVNTKKNKAFEMAVTKRTPKRSCEENLLVLHNLHDTIHRPDKTCRQITPCIPALTFLDGSTQ